MKNKIEKNKLYEDLLSQDKTLQKNSVFIVFLYEYVLINNSKITYKIFVLIKSILKQIF